MFACVFVYVHICVSAWLRVHACMHACERTCGYLVHVRAGLHACVLVKHLQARTCSS